MQEHGHHTAVSDSDQFPTDPAGLPEASASEVVELADGDEFELRIAPVAKRLGDATVRMLAYNGSIPGPTLRVPEGSRVVVNVVNEGDLEATVHWHGLRLENRYDGTHETQTPISDRRNVLLPPGVSRSGAVLVPPAHPRGLRPGDGSVRQHPGRPGGPGYWPPVHRELLLTLDDVLLEDGRIAPFSRTETTYAAMGRFGNVLLVGGEPDLSLSARRGEVVRLYLTNTANTRVFKVALPGARMKLVGGDSGRVEREQFVDVGDPRAVRARRRRCPVRRAGAADARAPDTRADLSARDDHRCHGSRRAAARPSSSRPCATNPDVVAERELLAPFLDAPPDKTLAFVAEMDMGVARGPGRLHLPDAPGGRQRRARPVPGVRDEAPGDGRTDELHLPDAPGGRQRRARPLPGVRHEAAAGLSSSRQRATATRMGTTMRATTATTSTVTPTTAITRPAGSSGKTTWSRSTA